MKELNLIISGMSCSHCVMAVKKEFSKLNLESADVQIGKAKIVYDEEKTTGKQITDAVEEAGFKAAEE
jgi:copper chaperone